jgi:hypothetical protein
LGTGLIWLMTGYRGGFLWTRYCISGFHKMSGISWLVERLLASQGSCGSLAFVSYAMTVHSFVHWSLSRARLIRSTASHSFGMNQTHKGVICGLRQSLTHVSLTLWGVQQTLDNPDRNMNN